MNNIRYEEIIRSEKNKLYITILVLIGIFSALIPFTSLFVFELVILVPLSLLVIFCFLIFFVILITGDKEKRKYPFKILLPILLPLILSAIIQLISIYSVEMYNNYRAKTLIEKLEEHKSRNNYYPKVLDKDMCISGIYYYYSQPDNEYSLSFNRDFLNNKVYHSRTREWETKPIFD